MLRKTILGIAAAASLSAVALAPTTASAGGFWPHHHHHHHGHWGQRLRLLKPAQFVKSEAPVALRDRGFLFSAPAQARHRASAFSWSRATLR